MLIRNTFGSKRQYGKVNIIGIGDNVIILNRVPVDSIYFVTKYVEVISIIILYRSYKRADFRFGEF